MRRTLLVLLTGFAMLFSLGAPAAAEPPKPGSIFTADDTIHRGPDLFGGQLRFAPGEASATSRTFGPAPLAAAAAAPTIGEVRNWLALDDTLGGFYRKGFTLRGIGGTAMRWSWDEFQRLPRTSITTDIHCVTKWSKFGTRWEGVSVDTLLAEGRKRDVRSADYTMAVCEGGYTTNVPLTDLTDGKGMVAYIYEGAPLPPEHGGPARLLVPHLYFWKSAKWLRELRFMERDDPGFWESLGYHIYGDPWREQRYSGDE